MPGRKGQRRNKMLGFVIFFIFFAGIFIFLGIALIRSIIIEKREHPYRYCEYPRPSRNEEIFKNEDFDFVDLSPNFGNKNTNSVGIGIDDMW